MQNVMTLKNKYLQEEKINLLSGLIVIQDYREIITKEYLNPATRYNEV